MWHCCSGGLCRCWAACTGGIRGRQGMGCVRVCLCLWEGVCVCVFTTCCVSQRVCATMCVCHQTCCVVVWYCGVMRCAWQGQTPSAPVHAFTESHFTARYVSPGGNAINVGRNMFSQHQQFQCRCWHQHGLGPGHQVDLSFLIIRWFCLLIWWWLVLLQVCRVAGLG